MDTKQIAKNKANIQLGSCPEKSAWLCFLGSEIFWNKSLEDLIARVHGSWGQNEKVQNHKRKQQNLVCFWNALKMYLVSVIRSSLQIRFHCFSLGKDCEETEKREEKEKGARGTNSSQDPSMPMTP